MSDDKHDFHVGELVFSRTGMTGIVLKRVDDQSVDSSEPKCLYYVMWTVGEKIKTQWRLPWTVIAPPK